MDGHLQVILILAGACLLVFFLILSKKKVRKIILRAVPGLLALGLVDLTGLLSGVSLGFNLATAGVSTVLGVPGVIGMLLLKRIMEV